MELLSFLKTAAHITGNLRYEKEYRNAALDMGYAHLATRYKELREEINYSDEELAMLPFYCLFRYERDEDLLNRYYRPAMDGWWENIVREDNPLWTFIYATGQPKASFGFVPAARTLYSMPVDTIEWTVKNSHRKDVVMDRALDRSQRPQAKTLLPRDELPVAKWNSNPFDVDGGSDGHAEDDGAAFLLPYWLGRYHRLLVGERRRRLGENGGRQSGDGEPHVETVVGEFRHPRTGVPWHEVGETKCRHQTGATSE